MKKLNKHENKICENKYVHCNTLIGRYVKCPLSNILAATKVVFCVIDNHKRLIVNKIHLVNAPKGQSQTG